jgi:hypothetical protein
MPAKEKDAWKKDVALLRVKYGNLMDLEPSEQDGIEDV